MDHAARAARELLRRLLVRATPHDDIGEAQLAEVLSWVDSGAPLWRIRKPADPPTHLVVYVLVHDPTADLILLVDHRGAGLWLPPGGHIELYEDPWQAVVRECREELRLDAIPAAGYGKRPLLVTRTRTRGHGQHSDVSLWFLVNADHAAVIWYDEKEFAGVRWLTPQQILAEPIDRLDPHMHRAMHAIRFADLPV